VPTESKYVKNDFITRLTYFREGKEGHSLEKIEIPTLVHTTFTSKDMKDSPNNKTAPGDEIDYLAEVNIEKIALICYKC
jgi:hypothetical protein